MIEYQRDQQQTIPNSAVKIIGVGGAGANMLDRVTLDGMEGAELLSLHCDSRSLDQSLASEKIQLGKDLTRGLGAGGDPEVGLKAAQEVETEIRDSLRDRKMVFICVGLGGGTGSGAAPLVARLAREVDAFVAVFATMPFSFEGKRRKEQAESALNELSVLANALVTFDNGRMGELVLAKAGIHDAFAAADRMVSDSIRAVTRIVTRPGLINVGLDDVMSALSSNRSRCLFGSGIAHGQNRSQQALSNALNSPLLDKGALLKKTGTALVHICGGEDMTLYEVELLMRDLAKHVTASAHIVFGAATDTSMGDSMSVTIISSLPEDVLLDSPPSSVVVQEETTGRADEPTFVETLKVPLTSVAALEQAQPEKSQNTDSSVKETVDTKTTDKQSHATEVSAETTDIETKEDLKNKVEETLAVLKQKEENEENEASEEKEVAESSEAVESSEAEEEANKSEEELSEEELSEEEARKISAAQGELSLDGGPKGKFEGEVPNVVDGEDLDVPPFMRKR